MYFLGQQKIRNQLEFLLPQLMKNEEMGIAMLFRAPSGYGKTTMALKIANFLTGGDFFYGIAKDGMSLDLRKRVVFIDEIHNMKSPEVIYPLLDKRDHVFLFATNDVAILPDALTRRCDFVFIFEPYSSDELAEMCRVRIGDKSIPRDFIDYIVESSGRNPGILRNMSNKVVMFLSAYPNILKGMDLDSFKDLMDKVFGIQDGMDQLCVRYIDVLKSVGGTASLATIANMLHADHDTIKYNVEPVLLYKGKLRISSKGRSLIE